MLTFGGITGLFLTEELFIGGLVCNNPEICELLWCAELFTGYVVFIFGLRCCEAP